MTRNNLGFLSQAQSLFAKGDREGLERLLDDGAQARVECHGEAPATPQFNRAAILLDRLKRKERRAS